MPRHPDPLRAEFFALARTRRAVGRKRYGTSHLDGPDLAPVLLEEAADAYNYARMEADRLARGSHDLCTRRRIDTLSAAVGVFGASVTKHNSAVLGHRIGFHRVAHARMHGVGAAQYGAHAYLGRRNLLECAQELCELYLLTRLEVERRRHQGNDDKRRMLLVLGYGDLAVRLAHTALDLNADVPAPPTPAALAA